MNQTCWHWKANWHKLIAVTIKRKKTANADIAYLSEIVKRT